MVLHELISREAWPSYFAPVIDFETRAVRIHEWELTTVNLIRAVALPPRESMNLLTQIRNEIGDD